MQKSGLHDLVTRVLKLHWMRAVAAQSSQPAKSPEVLTGVVARAATLQSPPLSHAGHPQMIESGLVAAVILYVVYSSRDIKHY